MKVSFQMVVESPLLVSVTIYYVSIVSSRENMSFGTNWKLDLNPGFTTY